MVRGEADDGVWFENAPAVRAFLSIDTQWRFAAVGIGGMVAIGLDYQGARAGLELAGIEVTPELWADLRVIEAAAGEAMNRKHG